MKSQSGTLKFQSVSLQMKFGESKFQSASLQMKFG